MQEDAREVAKATVRKNQWQTCKRWTSSASSSIARRTKGRDARVVHMYSINTLT